MYIIKSYLLALFFILMGTAYAQTTLVVDNNYNAPAGTHVFATIQEAVDAASANDIIQIQPSAVAYGNVIIDKPNLTLMGIGFNLDKDIPQISTIGNITLTNTGTNSTNASSTIITGLNFGILYPGFLTGASYLLSGILIENCQLQYIDTSSSGYANIDGFEIRGCYISASSSGLGIDFQRYTTNTLIRNNLIISGITYQGASVATNIITNNILYDGIYVLAGSVDVDILNNNFIGATSTETAFNTGLVNCTISNNIFYGSTPSIGASGSISTLFQGNTFSNNLIFSTGDNTIPPTGGGGGNIDGGNNAITDPDFVNSLLDNTWLSTYDFSLNGGSPAIDNGNDVTDIGITGGLHPWADGNLILKTTAVPTIQSLNLSAIINISSDLPIRVKAKSN